MEKFANNEVLECSQFTGTWAGSWQLCSSGRFLRRVTGCKDSDCAKSSCEEPVLRVLDPSCLSLETLSSVSGPALDHQPEALKPWWVAFTWQMLHLTTHFFSEKNQNKTKEKQKRSQIQTKSTEVSPSLPIYKHHLQTRKAAETFQEIKFPHPSPYQQH